MLGKHANKEGHAQKSSIIKWKWFIDEHATTGIRGDAHRIHEQVACFPPPTTLGPPEELPGPIASEWVVPMNSSQLTNKEGLGLWMGSSEMNGFL